MELTQNIPFPFKIEDVNPEINEEITKYFTVNTGGFVWVGPNKYFIANTYREVSALIYNMNVRTDDIFVSGFPRSGTTMIQELVWMVANDMDYKKSKAVPLKKRYTFLEFSGKGDDDVNEDFQIFEGLSRPGRELLGSSASSPKFIKTHLPLSLLPPDLLRRGKMVFVARDPRDVMVSQYHFSISSRVDGYVGDFKRFWNYFITDKVHWTPYFELIKEAWNERNNPSMLFLFYEDILKDTSSVVTRVSQFLGRRYSSRQVQELCRHLSFDNFKQNESVNHDRVPLGPGAAPFVRQGKVGGWLEYFDEEMTRVTDRWMTHHLQGTDLKYPHIETI